MSSLTVTTHALSSLSPVKFSYQSNKLDKLSGKYVSAEGGLTYFLHDAFYNYKDAALSKKTCLVLTDTQPVSSLFEAAFANTTYSIGTVAGSLYLTVQDEHITVFGNNLFVGNPCGRTGTKALITIVPTEDPAVAKLRLGGKYIQVEKEYPFTLTLDTDENLATEQNRLFYVAHGKNGLISFKTKTKEGFRFISYGVDKTLRAVGLELNETKINNYHFTAIYQTSQTLNRGFSAPTFEVNYFNDLVNTQNKTNLIINKTAKRDTNFLVMCSTKNMATPDAASIANIAMLKTNFSSSGTFLPSI
jgi:hypothetical protein